MTATAADLLTMMTPAIAVWAPRTWHHSIDYVVTSRMLSQPLSPRNAQASSLAAQSQWIASDQHPCSTRLTDWPSLIALRPMRPPLTPPPQHNRYQLLTEIVRRPSDSYNKSVKGRHGARFWFPRSHASVLGTTKLRRLHTAGDAEMKLHRLRERRSLLEFCRLSPLLSVSKYSKFFATINVSFNYGIEKSSLTIKCII